MRGFIWLMSLSLAFLLAPCPARADEVHPRNMTNVDFHLVTETSEREFVLTWMPQVVPDKPAATWRDKLDRSEVLLGEYDINGDGVAERFVMSTTKKECQEDACPMVVLWLNRGRWQELIHGLMIESKVAVLDRETDSYYEVYDGQYSTRFHFVDGKEVNFRHLETQEERRFALEQLMRYAETPTSMNWPTAIKNGRIDIAEADLTDDGVPVRFIMEGIGEYCGSAGCETLLLHLDNGEWKKIVSGTMGYICVLNEKTNGWHRLYDGHGIITFKENGEEDDYIGLDEDTTTKIIR